MREAAIKEQADQVEEERKEPNPLSSSPPEAGTTEAAAGNAAELQVPSHIQEHTHTPDAHRHMRSKAAAELQVPRPCSAHTHAHILFECTC